jgi:outer membrane protein assembly factor BamB
MKCRAVVLILFGLLQSVGVFAQSSARFREAVALDLDSTIDRRLETVQQHVAEQQWDDAVRFLLEVRTKFGSQLVKVGEGWYVSVDRHCANLIRQLPPAGLAAYRDRVDTQARQWFESAKASHNLPLMRRVVTETPLSRYEAEALSMLGDWEWQRGRPAAAEHYWQQLLSLPAADEVPDKPRIVAKLLISKLALGQVESGLETDKVMRQLTETTGSIAGETGALADIVRHQTEIEAWQQLPFSSETVSFAGDSDRTAIASPPESVRAIEWFQSFRPERLHRTPGPQLHPAFVMNSTPGVFPVTWSDLLFINDLSRIYAVKIETGQPAWSKDGVIFQLDAVAPRFPIMGTSAYSMTIDDVGRLFARMGSPVTVRSVRELTALRTEVVCLDIANGEGRELWRVNDSVLGPNMAFEGSPASDGERVYVAATQSGVRMDLFVVCLDAATGSLLWKQRVCTVLRQVDAGSNEVSHALLTVSDDHLVYSTNQGAVAALDKQYGTFDWVATYDSTAQGPPGVNPAIIQANRTYVAPSDSNQLMALDVWSGEVVWTKRLPDRIQHLLGIARNRLVASGRSLWALDTQSGRVFWGTPAYDPQNFGFGRGILAGPNVYWPKRTAIEVRSLETGRMVRPPINLRSMGITGGNLFATQQRLLISTNWGLGLFGKGISTQLSPSIRNSWY